MWDKLSATTMLEILDHVPGVVYASLLDPLTGQASWLYFSPELGPLFGISNEEAFRDMSALIKGYVEEDRLKLEQGTIAAIQSLAPIRLTGRIRRPNGEIRWLESHTRFMRREDGMIVSHGQVSDVTEQMLDKEALARSEKARKESDTLLRAVVDELPTGVIVITTEGKVALYNPAAETFAGPASEALSPDRLEGLGFFEVDGKTAIPVERLPLSRALASGEATESEMIVRNPHIDGERWIEVKAKPIRGESGQLIAAMGSFQDVTNQRALEQELRGRNAQLAASEEAKITLIERLRYAIDELSNPILEVWDDVLVIPIIGIVDSRRAADMVQRLLAEVVRTQASFVIVDLTGVEVVDTKTADHLMKLVRKVEMVGARCVLTGIRPAVAETLVDIGVDLGRLSTLRNLKHGLQEALRAARRGGEGLRDLDDSAGLKDPKPRQRGR